MPIRFNDLSKLDDYMLDNMYVNRTTDPTNFKYLYDDMIRDLEYYSNYTLYEDTLTILGYCKKYYTKISILDYLPDNCNPSFKVNRGTILIRTLLEYEKNLED